MIKQTWDMWPVLHRAQVAMEQPHRTNAAAENRPQLV